MLFRFGLGLADLTRERVDRVLAACQALEPVASRPGPLPDDAPVDPPHVALGLLLDAWAWKRRAPAYLRAHRAGARPILARIARVAGMVGWLPGVPRAAAHVRAWRARGRRRLAGWADAGQRERAVSRTLAEQALTVLRENMLARVSESQDLQRVIHEQSAGVAVTAVGELRDRSARADDLAEGAVGRLFGRGPVRRSR
jgi:hypothetical protein